MDIDELQMIVLTNNSLRAAGITTVEQLVALDWDQLKQIHGIGARGLSEICWSCIQVLNGNILDKARQWDELFPTPHDDLAELRRKAKKFDEIQKIVWK